MKEVKPFIEQLDPIKDNMLSVRALNCCRAIGVSNMSELQDYAKNNGLYNIRNCGRKTLLELQYALDRFYNSESICDDMIKNDSSNHISNYELYEDIFNDCILNSTDDAKESFLKTFPNINVFFSKIFENTSSAFIADDNITLETIFSCWNLAIKILEETNGFMSKSNFLDAQDKLILDKINKCYIGLLEKIDEAKNSLLLSRIHESLLIVLSNEFIQIKKKLSTRGKNVLDRECITYRNIYPFCSKTLAGFKTVCLCGKKTADEIISAYSSFYDFMYRLACSDTKEQGCLVTSSIFPFIKGKDVMYISQFKDKYGFYPFFKILSIYYSQTKYRNDNIWDKYNGITQPSVQLTDLAKEYNLTRERIRQLISRYQLEDKTVKKNLPFRSENYPFMTEDFINPKNVFQEVFEKEFSILDYFTSYSFVGILSLYNGFKSIECGNEILLIKKNIYDSFDFNLALADIAKTISSKIREEMKLPISIFITNYILNKDLEYNRIKIIIIYMLKQILNIELDENYNIILRQNSVDIEDEFFKILEANGSPMSFDDLCLSLQKHYPKLSYASGTLRTFLFNSSRISPIGKSSMYTLNKWNVNKLTIRGIIREVLEKSENPLSLDDIVDFLRMNGRHTSKNSVNSTILSDEKCDYVKFKGGLIGLASKTYDSVFKPIDKSTQYRKTFEERIIEFLDFVDANHHVPFSSSDEYEASLYRWYRNVNTGVLDVTPEQKSRFDSEMLKRQEYVMTSSEYSFVEKCKDFKYYVSTEFDLPNIKSNSSLYGWFAKNRQSAKELTGKKKSAWIDLVRFLADYGFHLE